MNNAIIENIVWKNYIIAFNKVHGILEQKLNFVFPILCPTKTPS